MRAPRLLSLFVLAVVTAQAPTFAASPIKPREVTVASSRVHVGDLVGGLAPDAAGIDLGPSPAAGGSRVVDRAEIVEALHAHEIESPALLPSSVRVIRKMKRLEVADIEHIVRQGLSSGLTRGVTLDAVHPPAPVNVPDGWTTIKTEVPRPPRRTGAVACEASVTFYENAQALWMMSVPVELMLSHDAAVADVVHGARLTLVIRRGLVEVSASGTAGADADIGDLVPIVLHPSGRTVLARLEDSDHAVALDTP
jgi:hypothetical protein